MIVHLSFKTILARDQHRSLEGRRLFDSASRRSFHPPCPRGRARGCARPLKTQHWAMRTHRHAPPPWARRHEHHHQHAVRYQDHTHQPPPACTTAAAAPHHHNTTRGYRACTTAALRCCVAQAKASRMAKPSRRTKEPSADVVKRTERKDKRAAAAAEVGPPSATGCNLM